MRHGFSDEALDRILAVQAEKWRVDTTTEYTDFPEVVIRDMRDENHLGNTVATACGQFTNEELRQHAHLIAAAPELLEAAFLAVEILRMTSERDGDDPYWNEGGEGFIAFMGLRDAIAKVKVAV